MKRCLSARNESVLFIVQLHDFDMCIAKNEEAIRLDPEFAECYGNMANALKVIFCSLLRYPFFDPASC